MQIFQQIDIYIFNYFFFQHNVTAKSGQLKTGMHRIFFVNLFILISVPGPECLKFGCGFPSFSIIEISWTIKGMIEAKLFCRVSPSMRARDCNQSTNQS